MVDLMDYLITRWGFTVEQENIIFLLNIRQKATFKQNHHAINKIHDYDPKKFIDIPNISSVYQESTDIKLYIEAVENLYLGKVLECKGL